MKKEIKFSLVYRDMWQSSGKYQPRVDQLVRIAPLIIEMGCFARVETNGGAFEQVNLLYGENPNKAVRAFTKPFNDAGIQTHMLDRGLNALRMYPVPADVRRLMYKVKHAQGVDITRIFCGLNETRNIIPSIRYALEAGMIPQATLCITHSPVHTVEYYAHIADQLIEAGAPEICLKDMAGIGRPGMLGELTKAIKEKHPDVLIQYHGHSGPGLSMASILEVCENGADIIDVAMEPMSWGKVHPDVISVQAMLRDKGFQVPDINMKAYMKARAMTQEFIDDFLGYFMDPTNKHMSSLLLKCGLPGGMMGSMMADLKGVLDSFAKQMFGSEVRTKFRPHHFPFTEPSAEMDVSCFKCGGKGCRVCKGSGWIEILGCGMVHPNVLKVGGVDTEKYTGFAFGMGVERIAMLKYGIDDIRLLYENHMRFIEQFK